MTFSNEFSWMKSVALHDQSWIWPWIKSIHNELNINFLMRTSHNAFMTSLAIDFDVIRRTQTERVRRDVWRLSFLASFMNSLCRERDKITYVLSWQTVYAPTRMFVWCLFPSLIRISENKHQNNIVWAHKQLETRVQHYYIYIFAFKSY